MLGWADPRGLRSLFQMPMWLVRDVPDGQGWVVEPPHVFVVGVGVCMCVRMSIFVVKVLPSFDIGIRD